MAYSGKQRGISRCRAYWRGASLLALALVSQPANAQMSLHEWTGAQSSDWFDPDNWDLPPPQATNTIISIDTDTFPPELFQADVHYGVIGIGNSGQGSLLVDSSSVSLVSVLSVGSSGRGELEIRNGSNIAASALRLGVGPDGEGRAVISGSATRVDLLPGAYDGQLDVGYSGSGALEILDGARLEAARAGIGIAAGSRGTVRVDGTGSALVTSGDLAVGIAGEGFLTISGGGSVSNDNGHIGGAEGIGRVLVTGAGSRWDNAGDLTLERDAYLTVSEGAEVSVGGGLGTLTLTSDSTRFVLLDIGGAWGAPAEAPGYLDVGAVILAGEPTSITFNHTGTGYVFDAPIIGQAQPGFASGSLGAVAGETILTSLDHDWSDMVVAARGGSLVMEGHAAGVVARMRIGATAATDDGLFIIRNGGQVTADRTWIAGPATAVGRAQISGPGSQLTTNIEFDVGLSGEGYLDIEDGGLLTTADASIGRYSTARGEATVSGAGSVWTLSGYLIVGNAGAGALTVDEGGLVEADNIYLGWEPGSFGDVLVTGAGSRLTAANFLNVGREGEGRMTIADGGLLESPLGYIARWGGSRGEVLVTGEGSLWSAGDISVGTFGEGTLTVADGAVVRASAGISTIIVGDGIEGVGVLNIGSGGAAGIIDAVEIRGGEGSATLNFNHNEAAYHLTTTGTASGEQVPIRGRIAVNHLGSGTTIFTGTQSFTGVVTISDGTLQIGNGGTSGNLLASIVNDSVLAFARSDDFTFSGSVGGTGDLVQRGSGVLRLTGAQTYTGATVVESGTLRLGGDTTGEDRLSAVSQLIVHDGAQLVFGNTSQRAGSLAGAGEISAMFLTGPGVYGGTLTIGEDDRDAAFTGDLLVGVLNKTGDGIQTLSGSHAVRTLGIFGGGIRVGAGGWTGANGETPNVAMIGGLLDLDGQALTIGTISDVFEPGEVNLGNGGVLTLASGSTTFSGTFTGTGELVKQGTGTFTLAGQSSFEGLLDIREGGVRLAGGGNNLSDLLTVNIASDAFLNVNGRSDTLGALTGGGEVALGSGALTVGAANGDFNFSGVLAGSGAFAKTGAGRLTLEGDSPDFAGSTLVAQGSLDLAGVLGGSLSVAGGGELTGSGRALGAVTIADGGILSGSQGSTFELGSLALSADSMVRAALGSPDGSAALFDVTGDLVLDGVLQVTDAGGFGAGVYRLFDYGGALTDRGLEVGSLPAGVGASDVFVQTAMEGQVNLVSSAGAELRFWDGAGLADDGAIAGGSGSWVLDDRSWTGADGAVNGAYDNPAFAIFSSAGGVVAVDGENIGVTGMQFAADGYTITQGVLELAGPDGETAIRVGDGTQAGSAMTATIGSGLAGDSRLVKSDLGTLVLTGANSYTGGTAVSAGTLIGDAGSIRGDLATAGTVVLDQAFDASFAGDIAGFDGNEGAMVKRGIGTLTLAGNSSLGWTIEAGGLTSATDRFGGDLAIGADGRFTFDQDHAGSYAGTISGSGELVFMGDGAVRLTGDSSGFAGLGSVSSTLVIDEVFGGRLAILDGGILGGSGTAGTTTVASGGTIAPGNSIGTLTIEGDLTFAAGSRYEVEVDPAGTTSDLIAVTGSVTIDGGEIAHIGIAGNYDPTSTYTILTADEGISGTFDAVSSAFAFLDPALAYGANAITLTLERNDISFADVGRTRNQIAAAGGVELLGFGNPIFNAVVQLDEASARAAFDQLSGEIHASARTALIEDTRLVRDAATDRVRSAFAAGATAAADRRSFAVWGRALGSWGETDSDGNAAALARDTLGFLMGGDARLGESWRLGLLAGYSRSSFDAGDRGSSGTSNNFHLGLYGGTQSGALGLRLGAAYSWHNAKTERSVAFTGFADSLHAHYNADTMQVFGEAGYGLARGPLALEPFARLAYVNLDTEGFSEEGGAAALGVQDGSVDTALSTLGLRAASTLEIGGTRAEARGMIGWRHAFGQGIARSMHGFGGPGFAVIGAPIAKDAAIVEAGIHFAATDNVTLGLTYGGQFGPGSQDHSAKLDFSLRF